MNDEERMLFVTDPTCRSTPLQPHHSLNQRNAIFDSCAATGMRPDIFHLVIPGRAALAVGVQLPDNESSLQSDGSFPNLFSTPESLADVQMAWDGLERVSGVISRERHLCKVQHLRF